VADTAKLNDSKVKKSIILSKKVKVWFWDTQNEYTGEAVALTSTDLTALIKIGGGAATTMIPAKVIMDGLTRHLTGRVVEFKISGQGLEAALKGTVSEIQKDFENPRRMLLIAKFPNPSEKNGLILNKLGSGLPTG
jgi:hypothetical protein